MTGQDATPGARAPGGPPDGTPVLPADRLTGIATAVMEGLGTPGDLALQVAESLVAANLAGHDSHGVIRLPWYAEFVDRGLAVPAARPEVVASEGATAVVDGRGGWGQPAALFAVERVAELAGRFGAGVVTVRNCNHVGRIGEYVERLAERGLAGVMWCNADPAVAPYGGARRMLGTNPFAAGIPSGDRPPVIVDFATAAVAEGKLRVVRSAGGTVAPGLIQDAAGNPSTDPEDYYAGGSLLPFGGHKGYGLSVLVELLGGALSGNHPSCLPGYVWGNGVVLIALRPAAFVPQDAYLGDVRDAADALRSSPPSPGADAVRLPGDPERATREHREKAGIPVPAGVWQDLLALGTRLGVALT
ncbi:Ldh family oxidoreductase [Sphaerisporangium aureirubrum]|uniref:Ldh family oxidoreductase n=1 Tax=Sphaerisporangium aureirubrum TaxID=1544736 RepID=A0ABW1NK95_9ACTN